MLNLDPAKLRFFETIPEDVHVFERQSRADRHTRERIVGDVAWHAGYFGEQVWQMPEHCSTTGQDHAFVDNIGRQFGRSFFKHRTNRPQ